MTWKITVYVCVVVAYRVACFILWHADLISCGFFSPWSEWTEKPHCSNCGSVWCMEWAMHLILACFRSKVGQNKQKWNVRVGQELSKSREDNWEGCETGCKPDNCTHSGVERLNLLSQKLTFWLKCFHFITMLVWPLEDEHVAAEHRKEVMAVKGQWGCKGRHKVEAGSLKSVSRQFV